MKLKTLPVQRAWTTCSAFNIKNMDSILCLVHYIYLVKQNYVSRQCLSCEVNVIVFKI